MKRILYLCLITVLTATASAQVTTWTADNGNGTYTNPLFYDEFSDPDMIRVGNDFYLAGTTMHDVPGLVILHSKDLVNWEFCSYCFDRFDIPEDRFSLKNGKEIYGQGIWAPCIRYNNGTFYVFSNVNGSGLQLYTSKDPKGPWKHINMGGKIYDLSMLFDDDGKVYAVHGYGDVQITEVKPDFSGYVENSTKTVIPYSQAVGEGHHFYKINGKYYIVSTDYRPMGRMVCSRADNVYGPYETCVISNMETLGTPNFPLVTNAKYESLEDDNYKFDIIPTQDNAMGCSNIHQGGIVDLPNGEWWGFSMQDFRAVGRTVCISPITWANGWPMYGLKGNLGRSPVTYTKPNINANEKPHGPYKRSDNFDSGKLNPIWQWNHNPDDSKWCIKNGTLQLQTLPATSFLWARNTLTQRMIGPRSINTVKLVVKNMKDGDFAGLGNVNLPYQYLGVRKDKNKTILKFCAQGITSNETDIKLNKKGEIWLRIEGFPYNETINFLYSVDGKTFEKVKDGQDILTPYQLKTFQGNRLALFAYNTKNTNGGTAVFDDFTVEEPMADRSNNIPIDKVITMQNKGNNTYAVAEKHGMMLNAPTANGDETSFKVIDAQNGYVKIQSLSGLGYLSVQGFGLSGDVRFTTQEDSTCLFLWQDLLGGDFMLLSPITNRYVGQHPTIGGPFSADFPGADPNRRNGCVFHYSVLKPTH